MISRHEPPASLFGPERLTFITDRLITGTCPQSVLHVGATSSPQGMASLHSPQQTEAYRDHQRRIARLPRRPMSPGRENASQARSHRQSLLQYVPHCGDTRTPRRSRIRRERATNSRHVRSLDAHHTGDRLSPVRSPRFGPFA
jgi:hypothetical protein